MGSFILKTSSTRAKKLTLSIGIVSNIVVLCFFKYLDFFSSTMNSIFNSDLQLLNLLLPLAISFFTFQQIEYLVDCYKGEVTNNKIINYTVFVTFFPHLIAGPITSHKMMMPQFDKSENERPIISNILKGLFIFSIGLFKKVVIADYFALWANQGFSDVDSLGITQSWVISLSYTFQLYFDFSGYSDMAIGVALLFNIVLPQNFNSPYKALSISDFWRRWHMTLSRLLRIYVYFPLGGSRKGFIRTCINLFITFLVCGIWHGAGWTFICWGIFHGLGLILHRIWSQLNIRLHFIIGWFLTFNFVNIGWVIFRSDSLQDARRIILTMFGYYGVTEHLQYGQYLSTLLSFIKQTNLNSLLDLVIDYPPLIFVSVMLIIAFIIVLASSTSNILTERFMDNRNAIVFCTLSAVMFAVSLIIMQVAQGETHFLYFNF
ncbi:MBOAT family O-acyltransferase [Cohnella abietis]|uniref:MBOAT family O-acyltransferase n=1 Tax=Cohnella abietis TaxID=2507935 RepID=UPI001E2D1CB2|nr:MBOAT family O-acyltransferase [Cohnella abietis]